MAGGNFCMAASGAAGTALSAFSLSPWRDSFGWSRAACLFDSFYIVVGNGRIVRSQNK
jgi:hypothetical protein